MIITKFKGNTFCIRKIVKNLEPYIVHMEKNEDSYLISYDNIYNNDEENLILDASRNNNDYVTITRLDDEEYELMYDSAIRCFTICNGKYIQNSYTYFYECSDNSGSFIWSVGYNTNEDLDIENQNFNSLLSKISQRSYNPEELKNKCKSITVSKLINFNYSGGYEYNITDN